MDVSKVSPLVNGGKKKNGATIWVGSKTIKRWSCIRVLLSVQVSKFILTCHTLHRLISVTWGVFGASTRATKSEISIRGSTAVGLANQSLNTQWLFCQTQDLANQIRCWDKYQKAIKEESRGGVSAGVYTSTPWQPSGLAVDLPCLF